MLFHKYLFISTYKSKVISIVGLFILLTFLLFVFLSRVEESYLLAVEEPSGLSYSPNRQSLYVTSDEGSIYQISLSGKIIRQLPYTAKHYDFEGITINPNNSNIYVINETTDELIELDLHGVLKNKYKVSEHMDNMGLEGVAYDAQRDVFYLLNEMQPGKLIVYSLKHGVKKQIELNFATDYSGIYFNQNTDKLWIISDEDNKLFKCTLDGLPEKEYYLYGLHGIEGIVINETESIAYVVSDSEDKLYKINLSD